MDLRSYFTDLNAKQAELVDKFGSNPVYVTSIFNRDRGSVEGTTLTASPRNAARVITDGTHREATKEEIAKFLAHQQTNLTEIMKSEQRKKQQFVVMMTPAEAGLSGLTVPPQYETKTASTKA